MSCGVSFAYCLGGMVRERGGLTAAFVWCCVKPAGVHRLGRRFLVVREFLHGDGENPGFLRDRPMEMGPDIVCLEPRGCGGIERE